MIKRENYNELLLDFKDFLWKLAAQWKAILIVTLVVGTIFAGMLHLARVNAYNNSLEEEKKATEIVEGGLSHEEQLLETLTDRERASVRAVLTNAALVDELSTYLKESVRLGADIYNVDTVNLQYSIRQKDGGEITNPAALSAGYSYCLNNSDFISGIKKDLGIDLDDQYIRELFTVEFSNTDIGAEELIANVKMIRPDDIPLEKISEAVTDRLVEYTGKLSSEENKSALTLKLRDAEEGAEVRPEILEEKAEIMKKIAEANISMSGQINAFNDSQLEVYEALSDETGEKIEGLVNTDEKAKKPTFSSKLLIIGWFIAFVLYIVGYALYGICRRRVRSADSLRDSFGLHVFGELYPQSKTSGLSKLFTSRKVMKLYHKEQNREEEFRHISSSVNTAAANCNSQSVMILDLSENNGASDTKLNDLWDRIRSSGIEVINKSMSRTTESSIDEFAASCESPIVIFAGAETKNTDIKTLMNSCRYYGKEILGAIYMEEI